MQGLAQALVILHPEIFRLSLSFLDTTCNYIVSIHERLFTTTGLYMIVTLKSAYFNTLVHDVSEEQDWPNAI